MGDLKIYWKTKEELSWKRRADERYESIILYFENSLLLKKQRAGNFGLAMGLQLNIEDDKESIVHVSETKWSFAVQGSCFIFYRNPGSKWAIFGKQNWRCGMNRKPGYGVQLRANLEPTKGVGRLRQQDGGHGS
ncbi:hypothetical protein HPP92_010687 [Vanilla planifolia]|uniref:Uncharacterized protein n=1 Tax=Vanilla planifolia TaxID=51239 RepID=A0A835V2R8_VANPL|nr:hypothetical protein HPP92_010687 [Vanilla planifolia]